MSFLAYLAYYVQVVSILMRCVGGFPRAYILKGRELLQWRQSKLNTTPYKLCFFRIHIMIEILNGFISE